MQTNNNKFGIIGGSGFYNLNLNAKKELIKTPFGKVGVNLYEFDGMDIVFIARHGETHNVPPHLVNYRANVYALNKLGVNRVIATSAVGSLHQNIEPGHFLFPNQFLDFTKARAVTFFDGKFSIKVQNNLVLRGIIHRDFTTPYCPKLIETLFKITEGKKEICHKNGVYICTEGPRFETPAEINAFRTLGGHVVGMTSVPEIVLARELGLCYGTICLITNYAAGMQKKITIEEVLTLLKQKTSLLNSILLETIRFLHDNQFDCKCQL